MIFYDATESRSTSNLPDNVVEYGYMWNRIERETGGDLVVIPELSVTHKAILMSKKNMTAAQIAKALNTPISEIVRMKSLEEDMDSVLFEYLYRGAIVVQRKSGSDLVDSIQGPRLDESLARMDRAIPYRSQRMLLYTGVFGEKDGKVTLNGKVTGLGYMPFVMALTAWCNRGGTVVNLASDDMILEWLKLLEKQLESYKHADAKFVYPDIYYPPDMPDIDDVLQVPIEVRDWRKTIVTFPGIGPDRANALKERIEGELGTNASLWNALQYACSFKMMKDVSGWGKKSVQNVRNWLGIPDDFELALQTGGDKA